MLTLALRSTCVVLLVAGCSLLPHFPRKRTPPPRPDPIQLGRVSLVDQAQHFALIEASTSQVPAAGTTLRTYSGNAVSAELRATAVRRRPFLVADLVSGMPGKGDVVVQVTASDATPRAVPTAATPSPEPPAAPKKRGWLGFFWRRQ